MMRPISPAGWRIFSALALCLHFYTAPLRAAAPVITQGAGPLTVTMSENGSPTAWAAPALAATDADTASTALTWSVKTAASNGTASVSGTGASPGTFTYAPTANWSGNDSFVVQVSDGTSTDEITLSVSVSAVADANHTVTVNGLQGGTTPIQVSHQGYGFLDSLAGIGSGYDVAEAAPAVSITGANAGTLAGTATINADGTLNVSFSGTGGPSNLTISVANGALRAPSNLTGVGTGFAIGGSAPTVTISGADAGSLAVTATVNVDGTLNLSFSGSPSGTGNLTITVTQEIKYPPVITQGAGPLAVIMSENGSPSPWVAPILTATDADSSAVALVWSVKTPASNGDANVTGGGTAPSTFTYSPNADFNGTDSFVVQVADDGNLTDEITVNVTITNVNRLPTFTVDSNFTTPENNASFSFVIGATDQDPNTTLVYSKSGPDADKFTLNVATGELSFTTPPDFEANASASGGNAYSLSLTVSDGEANATRSLTVVVTDANDPPVGVVTVSGEPEVGLTLTVDHNLTDQDGNVSVSYKWYRDGVPIHLGGTLKDNVNGVDGLEWPRDFTHSADGIYIYVTGGVDDSVSWFERNASSGDLTFRGTLKDEVNGVDGLDGAHQITLSADGKHAYITGEIDDSVSWFERNASSGALTYGGTLKDEVNGVDGLDGALDVTLSADGSHVYVTGRLDDSLSWFERNATSGVLTYGGTLKDEVNGVDGLDGALDVTLSTDGNHVYVTGHDDDSLSQFERNASSGALTYGGTLKDEVNGVDGLHKAHQVTLSADGSHVYVTGLADDSLSWFERNASSGVLTYGGTLKDEVNGVDGLDGALGVTLSADGKHVYVTGYDDDSLSWFERNASSGYLTYGGTLKDEANGVDGLDGPHYLMLSADANNVYVTGGIEDSLSWFERNATTGALSYGPVTSSTYVVTEADLGSVLTVVASYRDGGGTDENVTSAPTDTVTPYNRPPSELNATIPLAIAENLAPGSSAGSFTAADPDAGAVFTYTLSDPNGTTDNASFTLDANGALRAAATFDRETKASYQIRVRVTDQWAEWMERSFTVQVSNVNEAPVISQGASISVGVDEDGSPVSWPTFGIAELNATDVDGDALAWSLLTPPTEGNATVAGTGAFPTTFSYVPKADFNGTDSFVVQVSDGNLTDSITFNVRVNARPENHLIPAAKEVSYSLWPDLGADFQFTGGGYQDAPDPTLTLMEGTRYFFEPQVGGLTLKIGTAVGVPYSSPEVEYEPEGKGLGSISFLPTTATPRKLHYYVEEEPNMHGEILIIAGREQKLARPGLRGGARFGQGLDSFGSQVAIGSFGESDGVHHKAGKVNLFEKDQNGKWSSIAEILPDTSTAYQHFGYDVSLTGSVLLVGAPSYSSAVDLPGQAYVFEKVSGSWIQTAKLSPSNSSQKDRYGHGVSATANRLAVGAYGADDGNLTNSGMVYLYEREQNGSWGSETIIKPFDGQAGESFGHSVSLEGDRVLAGSRKGKNSYGHETGAAYLFTKVGGNWVQETKFTPWDSNGTDYFGSSVRLDGNYSYVSAYVQNRGSDTQVGAVYVFRKLPTGQWAPEVKLQPNDLSANGWFGFSLDSAGDSVLVGAPVKNEVFGSPGAAYWFQRDGQGNWSEKAKFTPYDGASGDRFGRAVALGATVFVGAPYKDDFIYEASGAAYAYENPSWNDTPPVLNVPAVINVEMDEDGSPVAWAAPNVSASDAGGDTLSWRAYYDNIAEANGTVIVSGTGSSPQDFIYAPRKNFYGTDTFKLEVTDGVYKKTVDVRVTVNGQLDEGEPITRMMPGYGHSTMYANAVQGQAIKVWGSVMEGQEPYQYVLDFGDGTSVSGSVTNPKYIGADHVYTTSGLKEATLQITDAAGSVSNASTLIRVFFADEISLDEKRNMAFEKGLLYLYLKAVEDGRMDGLKWYNSSNSNLHTVATTGMSLMAFTDFGHTANTPTNIHTYGDIVRKALRFLVAHENAGTMAIPDHSDGVAVRQSDNPLGKNPGKGAYLLKTGGHDSYSNSIAVMALFTAFPKGQGAESATVTHGPFAGWNYKELAEELIELLIWSQGDGSKRGGWEYYLTQNQRRHDGSVQQWPVLCLMIADKKWGLTVPQWAKDNVGHAYDFLTAGNGGVSYSTGSNWLNVDKTAGHLIADAWLDRNSTHPKVVAPLKFVTDRWMTNDGWSNNLYAGYGVKKGLDFIGLKTIQTPHGPRDWDADMASWLLGINNGFHGNMNPSKRNTSYSYGQKADGSWDGVFLDASHNRRYSTVFSTAFALAILSRGVTDFPPIPLVNYSSTVPAGKPMALDGSASYHSDASKYIKQWKWKWDWNGSVESIDWSKPDAVGPRPTHPGFATLGSFSFALQVTDNATPAESVVKVFPVSATSGNHKPIPVLIPLTKLPNYASPLNEIVTLDGSSSYDLDQYDSVTGYRWDLNGDGNFIDGQSTMTIGPFSYPNQTRVGLKVNDETFNAWSDPVYVDVFFSRKDLFLKDLKVDPFNLRDSNFTIRTTVGNDPNATGIARGQDVRLFDGNPFVTGTLLGQSSLPDLAPNTETEAVLTLPISSWFPEIYALVDPFQKFQEWDEVNNWKSFPVIPNYPPSDILITPAGLVENQPAGELAATLAAVDLDDLNGTGTYSYTMVAGTGDIDNQAFEIKGDKLKSLRSFDFEERSEYFVRVKVTDDKQTSFEKALVVPVVNADDHAPILSLIGSDTIIHEAMSPYSDPGATWTDAIDASGVVDSNGTSSAIGVVNIAVPGTYQLQFYANDASGNHAVSIQRSVVVRDTTKPDLFLRGLPHITLEAFTPYVDQGAFWVDYVDGFGSIEANGSVDLSKPGNYVLTYSHIDKAGNQAVVKTRTVTIIDTTAPILSIVGNPQIIHEAATPFVDPGATWSDAVDGNGSLVAPVQVNTMKLGTYVLPYDFTDNAGNLGLQVSRSVTVVDTTKPIISIFGDGNVTHEAATPYLDEGAFWTDTLEGNGSLIAEGVVNVSIPGEYLLTYSKTDGSGNVASPQTRKVSVQDTTKPVLSILGDELIVLEGNHPFIDPGAIWVDTVDGNGSALVSGEVNVMKPGDYILEYSYTDSSGNEAVRLQRTVRVVDTTNPLITLFGNAVESHEATTPYLDPGAIASDAIDGNSTIAPTGVVDIAKLGSYTLNFDYTDSAGNAATRVNRTVTVVDTTAPIVTWKDGRPLGPVKLPIFGIPALYSTPPLFFDEGAPPADFGFVWTDAVDGNGTALNKAKLTWRKMVASTGDLVNPDPAKVKPGRYWVLFELSDSSGNATEPFLRMVNVLDVTAPVITLNGPDTLRLAAGLPYVEQGALRTDAVDGNGSVYPTGEVETNQPGVYVLTYAYSDAAGNAATAKTRTVTIYNDAPTDVKLSAASVEENLPAGTLVGRFSTIDPNQEGNRTLVFTYELTKGEADFTLDKNGSLRTRRPFDYESQSTLALSVRTSDGYGGNLEKSFEVAVVDAFVPIVETHAPVTASETGGPTAKGEVLDAGGSLGVIERGFVAGTKPDPNVEAGANNAMLVLRAGQGAGLFEVSLAGRNLPAGQKLYLRAYAKNAEGVGYGTQETITLPQQETGPAWADAQAAAGAANWWNSTWFGAFHLSPTGWLIHEKLGWLYAAPASGGGVWLWREERGWLWTERSAYPFLFERNSGSWLYLFGTAEGQTLLYRYSDGLWFDWKPETGGKQE